MGKIKISKQEIKDMYISGKTLTEIAKIAECDHSNIKTHLERMNVVRRVPTITSRKYSINETYFEKVDNEKKAYILGFLYADGYNQQTKNQIRLTLQGQDVHILEEIKFCLDYNKPLMKIEREKGVYYDLSINSKKISVDLVNLGCMQAKTFKIKFPAKNIVPKEQLKHFIRGYFDGDGCISLRKTNQLNVLGTMSMIEGIQNELLLNCNINKTKIHKNGKVYIMSYTGNKNLKEILDYMYSDSNMHLNRKFEKYKRIIV